MQFMNDLKVACKMLILAVISLLGMCLVGVFGYSTIKEAQTDMEHMYAVEVKGLSYLGNIRQDMRTAQTMTVILTIVKDDPQRLQDTQEKLEAAIKDLNESLKAFEACTGNVNEVKEPLAAFKSDWGNLEKALTESAALSMKGQQTEGLARYNNDVKYAVSCGKDLTMLAEHFAASAEALNTKNDEDSAAAARNMIILFLLTLVILMGAIYWITKEITTPLANMTKICTELQNGDFTARPLQIRRGDEFGVLAKTIYQMRLELNKLMKQISQSSEQLAASSEELNASSSQSAQASEQVANNVTNSASAVIEQQQLLQDAMNSIEHATEAIQHLGLTARNVTDQAQASNSQANEGAKAIETAVEQIMSVEKVVNESAATVDKLGQSSQEIGQIVETISGIAEQTNLLSLNASIEAARAGEHGRGFAVVADEVRKLAEASQQAAQQIASLIGGIQKDTANAVASMRKGSTAVKEGTASVEELRETFGSIRQASNRVVSHAQAMIEELQTVEEDTGNIKAKSASVSDKGNQVAEEMESVSAASQEQSASAGEIASASGALAQLAQDLQNSLQKFKF